MEMFSAAFTRREALRARARTCARVYVRAAIRAQKAWNRASHSHDARDQDPYHAALLIRAAKRDMFLGAIAEMHDAGDELYRVLHAEAEQLAEAGCRAVDARHRRLLLRHCGDDETVGADQAPGWAFDGGSGP